MAVSWSIKDEANDVVKRTGEEEEEKRILLEETGGDVDDGSSSNIDDLFPHTTADMFRFHALSRSLNRRPQPHPRPSLLMQRTVSISVPTPTDFPIQIGPDPLHLFFVFDIFVNFC